jgi:hypothetical protein
MSFVTNGGKFKLYAVLNGLLFPTPTQSRISFGRAIHVAQWEVKNKQLFFMKENLKNSSTHIYEYVALYF